MNSILKTKIVIKPSDCDYEEILSYPDIFALFEDIATEQSRLFKYDSSVLTPKGLFWVISKNKAVIYRRPRVYESVFLSTWPEKPDRIRSYRNYLMETDDEVLIKCTTEWAVLDRNTGRLYNIIDLYEPDFDFGSNAPAIPHDFHRFTETFSDQPFGEYKVRSVDIDFEGHMNNVAYGRALFGLFSRKEIEQTSPREIEFYFKAPCFEGDRLLWYRNNLEDRQVISAKLENGTDIFFASLR